MKALLMVLVSLIFFFLQITIVNNISFGDIAPDFPMLLVVYLSIHRLTLQGTIIGFVIGFIQDLFNPMLLGLNALIKSITGFIIGEIATRTVTESTPFIMLLFFLSKSAADLIYSIFYFRLDPGRVVLTLLSVGIPSALYTAVLGGLVHLFVRHLGTRVVRAIAKAK